MKQELDHAGRFLSMVVDYKHKIGFKGTILIEPKPQEPTKHQYDYDVATVLRLPAALRAGEGGQGQHRERPRHPRRPQLRARDRHRRRARHLRLDRREPQRLPVRLGHRPVPEQRARDGAGLSTRSCKAGGFTTGGFNFDAKVRRQSLDPADLIAGPCRRHGRLRRGAARRRRDDRGRRARRGRRPNATPAGTTPEAQAMLTADLDDHRRARRPARASTRSRVSGRQERLENWSTASSDPAPPA